MSKGSNATKRRPTMGNIKVSAEAARQIDEAGVKHSTSEQVDRTGDRLLQLPQMSEISTLTEPTLRWMRHRGEGPPMFKLGRRLVCWERDLIAWINEQAEGTAAAS
jgi:predicted DNA-binding transcriptional regulator AlpA